MRKFGLIGRPLAHSASARYFGEKFAREHLHDCSYALYELESIDRFPALLAAEPDLCGVNVTIPYKQAVLPLLERLDWSGSARWKKQLMDDVRLQAAYYPRFLEPRLAPGEALTPTELQILHLICADKSNAEIGQIMDIKLPTVKTHVSHILDKLDVRRRSEAKTAAKRLRLIPEDR